MTTPRGAPELAAAQALPETTVNEKDRHTGAGAEHYAVVDKDLTAPPGSCSDGARYIVAATATGLWAGKENKIAIAVGVNAASGWLFANPVEGTTAYIQDENARYLYGGANWALDTTGGSVAVLNDLTDVDTSGVSDGDVLTYDSGSGEWLPATPTAGVTTLAALTDVDTTGAADGDVLTYDSGSGDWLPAAPTGGGGSSGDHEVAPPDTTLFSLSNNYNSATMSATYSAGKGLSVQRTDTGTSGNRISFMGKATPAGGSWTAEMGFRRDYMRQQSGYYQRMGLMLLENATGKWAYVSLNSDNGGLTINSWYGTSTTSDSAIANNPLTGMTFPPYIRFRVVYNGTTYAFYFSLNDGITWLALSSVAKTTAFTTAPDRIGVGLASFGTFVSEAFNPTIIYYDDPDV